jgi:Nuclease-related domain
MHHPSPDPDDRTPQHHDDLDGDEPEEIGTPVYQGTGLSVRALTAEELDRFLAAHTSQAGRPVGAGWHAPSPTGPPPWGSPDPTAPAAAGWQPPMLWGSRLAPRGGYGSPGRSALQTYRRERGRQLAGWARTAGWRAAGVVAAGLLASLLAQLVGLNRLSAPVGLAAGIVVGWRLRFRVSRDARAWRDGARGERATARLLRRLARRGYAVFHDVGIPGTPANADHLLIGPAGVVLVDSKRYTGTVSQTPDGRVWHNHYPMDQQLRALCLETEAISAALGVPVRPVMCVHGAQVASGGLRAGVVEILPAGRLPGMLRHRGQRLQEADVAALVAHALEVLHPAG